MSWEDEYMGRIAPDEAREARSRAESDCEHMPSAAWRALHAVGQMHYEYAVLEDVGYWRQRGELFETFEEAADYRDMKSEDAPMCVVRRLVGEPEVVE